MPLTTFLKLLGPVFALVGVLYFAQGYGAYFVYGMELPPEAFSDPSFTRDGYLIGSGYVILGALCYLCAIDARKYANAMRFGLWFLFTFGVGRLAAFVSFGFPAGPVLALLVMELVLPPLLGVWLSRVLRAS